MVDTGGREDQKETTLRKLFLLLTGALLVVGMAGTASANPLNWTGTAILLVGDFPRADEVRGGGVATINKSNGLGHINELRLAASRGNLQGT